MIINSPSFQLIQAKGWAWRQTDAVQVELERCPYCGKNGYGHFYIECRDPQDEFATRDGLHTCHRCGRNGNLFTLKQYLGVTTERERKAPVESKADSLPDVEACHTALMQDGKALDYLINVRGFSHDIIQRQKLGLKLHYFRETGEVRALVYPFMAGGNCVWAQYRTLPEMSGDTCIQKAFNSPSGYDAVLYNGDVLRPGITEITLVEGAADCIAALDKGITNICGVPGANIKKAAWIDTLHRLEIERIYIWYDKDTVGQKAAQTLASRIGLEKCWRITLPDFTITTDEGLRAGKDANEWFAFGGGTRDGFEKLKEEASMFDVAGVSSVTTAIQSFYDELAGKDTIAPKYKTQWPDLNALVGFDEGDVIDILAPEKIGKTTFGLNLMEYMVDTYAEDGIIICLEMTQERLARKYICMVAGIADNIPKSLEEEKARLQEFRSVESYVMERATNRAGHLYFAYPMYKSVEDVYELIRNCHKRYGVKWIMLDNIQRLCDTTIGSKNRTQHLSEISKVTSQLAKDYKVQMVRILQPHRLLGKEVTTDNVDGASQIAKDCDCMVTLHRDKTQAQTFSPKMKVVVGLSRYSIGGETELYYDGARSKVTPKDTLTSLMASVGEGP